MSDTNGKPKIPQPIWGEEFEADELLRDRYIEPPFSILDARGGSWQRRRRVWLRRGIRREVSREGLVTMPGSSKCFGASYGREHLYEHTVSVFDPVLAEVLYHWFCPPGGSILDPFAGGSVRGLVAACRGHRYTGIDLRAEQVQDNQRQAGEVLAGKNIAPPLWLTGDSEEVLPGLVAGYDLLMTCPPYLDLERYSSDPRDLSNMKEEEFYGKFCRIMEAGARLLNPNAFIVVVVGDIRDRAGYYRRLPDKVREVFNAIGWQLYNEVTYIQPTGTAQLRADLYFRTNRKCVKMHENVLIFFNGKIDEIRHRFKN